MRWGRAYFALQAIAGLAWWVAVFESSAVRVATLGGIAPAPVAWFDIPLFVVASGLAAGGVKVAGVVAAAWTCLVALGLAVYSTVTTEAGWGVMIMASAAGASVLAATLLWSGRIPTEELTRGPFEFRPAAPRTGVRRDVLFTLIQMVVFWGVFLVVVPGLVALLERRWRLAATFPAATVPVGICLLVLASALGVASAIVMSTRGHGTPLPSAMPNRLVVAGPYRWVRNPMAVAGIVQGVAVSLILSSWLVVVYAVVGSALWNYAIRPQEEADLLKRFGMQFADYHKSVRCWIPRVRRWTAGKDDALPVTSRPYRPLLDRKSVV